MFYDGGVISGTILREARRRAGLSQAALGRRVGRPQTQIARWERGAVLPSLETLRELVRACGLDVTIGLAAYDNSYVGDVRERLALAPQERLARAVAAANAARALRGERPLDPLGTLCTLHAHGGRFILVGALAAVLRGSPLLPVDMRLALVPEPEAHNLDRIRSSLAETGHTHAEIAASPTGTAGYVDLRRDATPVRVADDLDVVVASLADLVRIAEASPDPAEHAQVVALRTTLELAQPAEQGGRAADG